MLQIYRGAAGDQAKDVGTFVEDCAGARVERPALGRRILDRHASLR
jgi:hypothetical protein